MVEIEMNEKDKEKIEEESGKEEMMENIEKIIKNIVVNSEEEMWVRMKDEWDRRVILIGRMIEELEE